MTTHTSPEPPERESHESQSWDEFWREQLAEQRTETIRGVTVRVPTDLPLRVEWRLAALARHEADEETVRGLLADLFGDDVLDQWVDAGMGAEELQVLLVWAISHGKGEPLTFRQALDVVRQGKAAASSATVSSPILEQHGSPAPSAATGGRSRPTSAASTGSHRRRSRR